MGCGARQREEGGQAGPADTKLTVVLGMSSYTVCVGQCRWSEHGEFKATPRPCTDELEAKRCWTRSEWDLLCEAADAACPHVADGCSYNRAVAEIFARNEATVSQAKLALALRAIIMSGPSKTTRVPFLVGPSNTGRAMRALRMFTHRC